MFGYWSFYLEKHHVIIETSNLTIDFEGVPYISLPQQIRKQMKIVKQTVIFFINIFSILLNLMN